MDDLLNEIDSYCAETGMSPTTFGAYAVRDGKLVGRLRRGGEVLPRTAAKIRAFIEANPPTSDKKAEAAE